MEKYRKLSLQISNKSDHYRVFTIEPIGYRYGMDSNQSFAIIIVSDDFELYVGDTDKEMMFTFENFNHLEISVWDGDQEIFSGHNLLYN